MVVSNLSPAQVTPFSLSITVWKIFRETSNFVIPDQTSMPSETLDALNRDLENEITQKDLEYKELKVAKEILQERLEKSKRLK